tara:strand:- start:10066 stop:11079 length:1014 start_codon:yes stop_codon:yes gene_type:complete
MTFFNKKEEVIDLKLTPHGRYLLSIGELKPVYYCFLDNDIIYDSQAIGYTEIQNQANDRIINETAKLKVTPGTYGVETTLDYLESNGVEIDDLRQQRSEKKINKFPTPIGMNPPISQRTSTIHTVFLSTAISSSSHYYSGSLPKGTNIKGSSTLEIIELPQLNTFPTYNIITDKLMYRQELELQTGTETSELFSDNSYFRVLSDIPLLYFKEVNSFNFRNNYDIEVFEVDEQGDLPIYKKLKFRKPKVHKIVDGFLVEMEDAQYGSSEYDKPDDYVDHYFDILTDDEISPEFICEYIDKAEEKNIYIDGDIKCPDREVERFNIYGTRVSPSDIERCD